MTLADYLASRSIRLTDFAQTLGVKVTTLHGYVTLKRRPPVEIVAKVEDLTCGAVRAQDFVPGAPQNVAA